MALLICQDNTGGGIIGNQFSLQFLPSAFQQSKETVTQYEAHSQLPQTLVGSAFLIELINHAKCYQLIKKFSNFILETFQVFFLFTFLLYCSNHLLTDQYRERHYAVRKISRLLKHFRMLSNQHWPAKVYLACLSKQEKIMNMTKNQYQKETND